MITATEILARRLAAKREWRRFTRALSGIGKPTSNSKQEILCALNRCNDCYRRDLFRIYGWLAIRKLERDLKTVKENTKLNLVTNPIDYRDYLT